VTVLVGCGPCRTGPITLCQTAPQNVNHFRASPSTRIPGLVREHRADKANDDIRNSARTKGCVLKTRRIPRTLSALLLVELSIQGFYWIFATLAHAQNKSWCSRTNPDTRVHGNRYQILRGPFLHQLVIFKDSVTFFMLSTGLLMRG